MSTEPKWFTQWQTEHGQVFEKWINAGQIDTWPWMDHDDKVTWHDDERFEEVRPGPEEHLLLLMTYSKSHRHYHTWAVQLNPTDLSVQELWWLVKVPMFMYSKEYPKGHWIDVEQEACFECQAEAREYGLW